MIRKEVHEQVVTTITLPGDRNSGICEAEIKIDFGEWRDGYDGFFAQYDTNLESAREYYRKGLQKWADEWHMNCGKCGVRFGDECGDCGRVGCQGACTGIDPL